MKSTNLEDTRNSFVLMCASVSITAWPVGAIYIISTEFKGAEMEPLLDQDSGQTQEEHAETLGMNQQAISGFLKVLGLVQQQESEL
ncbi:hypothetical protein NECAME_01268 [Necator americanus]|uniref:Uncharacterized protein n=1 Tax=Necator americanus TaxID=51031 RepID=W2TZK5_NECAM|nr:hypothetical protein NECAME_01268 [Necator americanus]ETN87109.1 hypothetical protein NECAME_01268 [Necator americanus]